MALTFVNQVGAVEGMNQAAPGTLIPESFVRWSQDVLFDRAGLMRRRGPFQAIRMYNANGTTNTDAFIESGADDEYVIGILSTYDPNGDPRIGMLVNTYDASANPTTRTILRVFDNAFKFLGEQVLFSGATAIENLSIVSVKPALGGGVWVSLASDPENSGTHYQFFWRGGSGEVQTARTSTITALTLANSGVPGSHSSSNTWAAGHKYYSKQITVSTTGLSVGMFVYVKSGDAFRYIGTIQGVGASSITLEKYPFIWDSSYDNNSTFVTQTPTLVFSSIRAYEHLHGRGLLNTTHNSKTITSGDLGTSAEGHWKSAGVGTYFVYRASDNVCFGKVDFATDNKTADLVANPGADTKADEYIMKPVISRNPFEATAYRVSGRDPNSFAGLYTAVYAGYQWYGNFANDDQNTNRVVFSAPHDREAVDLSLDAADSIIFPGKSQFRGLGSSSAGLLVFLEDRTYILRGNDRTNFSVEQLVPEGCLCPSSVVEYGGGVFWAGKSGIMYFDGASVRNLTKDNLGLYYTDSLDVFNPETDRVIGFIHKNNLVMHYTSWKSPFDPVKYEPVYVSDWNTNPAYQGRSFAELDPEFTADDLNTQANVPIYWDRVVLNNPEESAATGLGFKWNDGGTSTWKTLANGNIYKWGPIREYTSMTFCLYLPTTAVTTFSNMDFRGVTNIETTTGLKTLVGVNSVEDISGTDRLRARLIDIHPVFDTNTNGEDDYVIEKLNIPYADLVSGPDFYLQTKHFTVGDPVLRKWFQKIMISMLLYDGALRMDLVDDDDNDEVDIVKKKRRYWDLFTEKGYTWDYLGKGEGYDFGVVFPKITSPLKSTWLNVERANYLWDELFTSDFNRYSKRISWRKSSVGFRLYQLNRYKKPFHGVVTTPNRVEVQSFSIGFKPMRQGRV